MKASCGCSRDRCSIALCCPQIIKENVEVGHPPLWAGILRGQISEYCEVRIYRRPAPHHRAMMHPFNKLCGYIINGIAGACEILVTLASRITSTHQLNTNENIHQDLKNSQARGSCRDRSLAAALHGSCRYRRGKESRGSSRSRGALRHR